MCLCACVCVCVFPGGFAANVVRAFPRQGQQLSLPGGMMQPGERTTSAGTTADLFFLIRGKERGHTHHEAMLSSLHAFHRSVKRKKNPSERTPECGSQRPDTTHLCSVHPSLFHLRFLLAVSFLSITAHPASAVFCAALVFVSFPLFPSSAQPSTQPPSTWPFSNFPPPLSSVFFLNFYSGFLSLWWTKWTRPLPPPTFFFRGLTVVRHGWGLYVFF